jgi:hypothetical protein
MDAMRYACEDFINCKYIKIGNKQKLGFF